MTNSRFLWVIGFWIGCPLALCGVLAQEPDRSPEFIRQLGTVNLKTSSRILAIGWNATGTEVTACDEEGSLRTWSSTKGKLQSIQDIDIGSGVFAFGTIKPIYTFSTEDSIDVIDLATGKSLAWIDAEIRVDCLCLMDQDQKIALPTPGNRVTIFDIKSRSGPISVDVKEFKERKTMVIKEVKEPRTMIASPDAKSLAIACADNSLLLIDVATGGIVWKKIILPQRIQQMRFTPDGKSLATVDGEDRIEIWDVKTGRNEKTLQKNEAHFISLWIAKDNRTLIAGEICGDPEPSLIYVWDLTTGKELRSFPGDPLQNHILALSPDETMLAVGGEHNTLRLIDLKTGKLLHPTDPGHTSMIRKVAFSLDGKKIITASEDTTIGIWDSATAGLLHRLEGHHSIIRHLALDPNGQSFYSGGSRDPHIYCWDLHSGKRLRTITNDYNYVGPLAFASVDGKSFSLLESASKRIKVYQEDQKFREIPLSQGVPFYLFVPIPNRKQLMLAFYNTELAVLDLESEKIVRTISLPKKTKIKAAALSTNGHLVAVSTGFDIFIYESATLGLIKQFPILSRNEPFPRNIKSVHALAFLRDGRIVVGGPDYQIRFFDVETGKNVAKLKGHVGYIESLVISPDGSQLLSGSSDSTAILWKLPALTINEEPLPKLDYKQAWLDLKSEDPSVAYKAIWNLNHRPAETLALFAREIKLVESPSKDELGKSIDALSSARFPVRQNAIQTLEKMDALASAALKRRLADDLTSDERIIIESLLKKHHLWFGDHLRELRAIQCLELIGTVEAQKLLETWSHGVSESRLTREAKAALERFVIMH